MREHTDWALLVFIAIIAMIILGRLSDIRELIESRLPLPNSSGMIENRCEF